jgi:hypothetical protein
VAAIAIPGMRKLWRAKKAMSFDCKTANLQQVLQVALHELALFEVAKTMVDRGE